MANFCGVGRDGIFSGFIPSSLPCTGESPNAVPIVCQSPKPSPSKDSKVAVDAESLLAIKRAAESVGRRCFMDLAKNTSERISRIELP